MKSNRVIKVFSKNKILKKEFIRENKFSRKTEFLRKSVVKDPILRENTKEWLVAAKLLKKKITID